MEENHPVLRPLLNPSTTTTATAATVDSTASSDSSSLILRISLVALIGIISLWANHEASKGYAVTIVNESGNTAPGKRFQLFYISNDEATRTLMRASQKVESFLYPDYGSYPEKQVNHIILKLAGKNLTKNVIVSSRKDQEFVITISPSIMESTNFKHSMVLAIHLGVARTWLWDGHGEAPENLLNGIADYIANNLIRSDTVPQSYPTVFDRAEPRGSSTACWRHNDSSQVAEFLEHCERRGPGFIRKLNQAMMDGWDDDKLDGALGQPAREACTSYEALRYNLSSV